MRPPKKPTSVEMPNGEVRLLRERQVDLDFNQMATLGDAATYLTALMGVHPADAKIEDNTPYECAELRLVYDSPETDDEFKTRMDILEQQRLLREKELAAIRDKAIQKHARRNRPLTPKQELALLKALKEKYPDGA